MEKTNAHSQWLPDAAAVCFEVSTCNDPNSEASNLVPAAKIVAESTWFLQVCLLYFSALFGVLLLYSHHHFGDLGTPCDQHSAKIGKLEQR
jgi:hypothetical protein